MGPTVAAAHSACSSRLELVEEVASRPSSSASLTNMEFHPSLPKLSILFDHENAVVSAKVLLNHFRPELHSQLKNEELILEEFTGGITNKLLAAYFASDKRNKTLIRVYGAETEKMIDRAAEIRTLLTLHRHRCSARLYGIFDNGMCYEYVAGQPLTLNSVRDDHISRLVIEQLVQVHCVYREDDATEVMNLFDKMSSLLQLVPSTYEDQDKQRRFKEYYPDPRIFAQEIESLKHHLNSSQVQSPKVLCHNDLLCANILFDKDKDSVSFIDFEYAGLNFQAYDLANHFNEFAGLEDCDYSRYPNRDYQMSWLKHYLKCWNKAHSVDGNGHGNLQVSQHQVESLYVIVNKFTLASHLFWILWTLIQAKHSEIDFDFLKYGKIRFDEYNRRKEELFNLEVPSSY